jgi:protein SYS1
MGKSNGPYAWLDYCFLLDYGFRRRVSTNTYYFKIPYTDPQISIYYIYQLIRRPRLILDFALTLVFNHLVLTTYYSASLPYVINFYNSDICLLPPSTSLFFWLVMVAGSVLTVILAEQLCVKREMMEGLVIPEHEAEAIEMGGLLRRD